MGAPIAVFGANGRMGALLCQVLMRRGYGVRAVIHHARERLDALPQPPAILDPHEAVAGASVVLLCVRPPEFPAWASVHPALLRDRAVLSCMAGWQADRIAALTGAGDAVHFMPSVTMLTEHGTQPAAFAEHPRLPQRAVMREILGLFGRVIETPEERVMEYTHLSSCMPALLCEVVRVLTREGACTREQVFTLLEQTLGAIAAHSPLPRAEAEEILRETLLGTQSLLREHAPEQIIDLVCTPGGLTEYGIARLRSVGLGPRHAQPGALEPVMAQAFAALHEKFAMLRQRLDSLDT